MVRAPGPRRLKAPHEQGAEDPAGDPARSRRSAGKPSASAASGGGRGRSVEGRFLPNRDRGAERLASRSGLPPEDRGRLGRFLKVLANSTAYGIYAEIVRHELAATKTAPVEVYRIDGSRFDDEVGALEEPGEYAFPPLAACTTAAARLMLAMLERCVADAGGSFVFCDTDSMANVAIQHGKLVPCSGGTQRDGSGRKAVQALSWEAVEAIRARFAALNPYDRAVVPGSILELEKENLDPVTRRQRQLWVPLDQRQALRAVQQGSRRPRGRPQVFRARPRAPAEPHRSESR